MTEPDPEHARERLADRLRDAGLDTERFIDVPDGEKGSHDHNQRVPDDPRLSGNYGIYAGRGAGEGGDGWLVDVDVDDYDADADTDALDAVRDLPPTLTVETPHTDGETGGHRFYAVTGNVVAAMKEVAGASNPSPSWGEVRVANQYVVGPGSQLDGCDKDWCDECETPDGGRYRIAADREIASITAEQLADVLRNDPAYSGEDTADVDSAEYNADGDTDAETIAQEHDWISNYLAFGDDDRSAKDHAVCATMIEHGVGEEDARTLLDGSPRTKVHDRGADYWRSTWQSALRAADTDENDENGGRSRVSTTQPRGSDGQNHRADGGTDALTPTSVMAAAGLGEDNSIADLTDRVKAYHVHQLIADHDDEHLLAVEDGTLLRCDDGVWTDDGEQRLRELGRRALGPAYSRNVLRELKEQVRASGALAREDMGAPRGTVAVENGLLDLETRELRDLRPEDHALFRVAAPFDPDAECPRFREFVGDVVRPDDIPTLQEYAGYTLLHWAQPYKRALLLLGPQDSGKSTFLSVVRALLGGRENVSSENLNSLVNERFGKANLHGKVANITNELETRKLESVGLFKTLTGGGDPISAEFKNKDKFEFVPAAKQLFAANRVPPTQDADDAFYSRWLFVTFPESVPHGEQVRELDKQLLTDERAGILNWMLDGYARLHEQDGFTNDPLAGAKRERWEAYGNSIQRFKQNCLEPTGDPGDVVAKAVTHDLYARHCREKVGTEVETQSKLTRELKKDENIGDGRRKVHPDDKRRTVYTGVKFHPAALDALAFDPGAKLADLRTDDDHTGAEDIRDGDLAGFAE